MKILIFFVFLTSAAFAQKRQDGMFPHDTSIHFLYFGKRGVYDTPKQKYMLAHKFQVIEWTDTKYRVMRIYPKEPQYLDYYTEWKLIPKGLRKFLEKYGLN